MQMRLALCVPKSSTGHHRVGIIVLICIYLSAPKNFMMDPEVKNHMCAGSRAWGGSASTGRAGSWCFVDGLVPKVNWLDSLNLLSSKEHATHTETLCPKFVAETWRGKSGMLGCGLAVVSCVSHHSAT